jgi:hypothetical protein
MDARTARKTKMICCGAEEKNEEEEEPLSLDRLLMVLEVRMIGTRTRMEVALASARHYSTSTLERNRARHELELLYLLRGQFEATCTLYYAALRSKEITHNSPVEAAKAAAALGLQVTAPVPELVLPDVPVTSIDLPNLDEIALPELPIAKRKEKKMNSAGVVQFSHGGALCSLAPGVPVKHPVTPGALAMCMRDNEFREGVRNLTYGHPALVMPVPHSPLLVYLMHTTKDPFRPSVVDSLQMISLLYTVFTCYSFSPDLAYYKQNKPRIDQAISVCHDALVQHRARVDRSASVHEFAVNAYQYTFQLINELETCLCRMFDINVASLLTPYTEPGVVSFPNEAALRDIQEHVCAVHASIGRIAVKDPTREWFFPLPVAPKHTMLPFISDQRLCEFYEFWEIGK